MVIQKIGESWEPKTKPTNYNGERVKFPHDYIRSSILAGHAVCFDFDGVIHAYSQGYKDGSIYDTVNDNALRLMSLLTSNGVPCFICSTRKPEQIVQWWNDPDNKVFAGYQRTEAIVIPDDMEFWNDCNVLGVTNRKLPAQLYIDDRAYRYQNQTVQQFIDEMKDPDPNPYGMKEG